QPILLAGRDYANDLNGWLANRPSDAQLVASVHLYKGQLCQSACWDSTIVPVAAQAPVIISEFGSNDCSDQHIKSVMDWGDAHGTPKSPNGTAFKAHLDALPQQPGNPTGPANSAGPTLPTPVPTDTTPASQTHGRTPSLAIGGLRRQRLDGAVEVTVTCAAR